MSRREASTASLLSAVWPYARPEAWALGLALAVTPLVAALQLAQPWLLRRAIDAHIVPGDAQGLLPLAGAYLGVVTFAYLLQVAYTMSLSLAGSRTIQRLRSALFRHILGLSQRYLDGQPTGRLMTRVTSDVEALGDAITAGAITIALDALVVVGVLVAMALLDPGLTLVALLLAPPLLLAVDRVRRVLRRLFVEVRDAVAAVNAFMAERIDGVEVLQLQGAEALAAEGFDQRNAALRAVTSRSNVFESLLFSMVDGFGSVVAGVLLWAAAGAAGRALGLDEGLLAPVSAGTVVAFVDYLDRLFVPLREASNKVAILQRAVAGLVKITELLADGERAPAGGAPVGEVRGHLVLRDVRFAYRPGLPDVLRGVDLEVRPGQVVALVGATGSGKTTITRLLDRSYEGYRGSITLDGQELSGLRVADLRRHVAAVRQDPQIFSEELAFNVGLGNPGISRQAMDDATRLVHADRTVHALGWTHLLRERGADLSVGEGQLLTFARTMAHDPDLILLDEATASIDSLTEALVQDALQRIFTRKTVIVVAHRLSTVQAADRIFVLEAGRVVEAGRHEELLARGGRYAALARAGEGVLGGT